MNSTLKNYDLMSLQSVTSNLRTGYSSEWNVTCIFSALVLMLLEEIGVLTHFLSSSHCRKSAFSSICQHIIFFSKTCIVRVTLKGNTYNVLSLYYDTAVMKQKASENYRNSCLLYATPNIPRAKLWGPDKALQHITLLAHYSQDLLSLRIHVYTEELK